MTRFSTPQEVLDWAEKAAAEDLARHLPIRHDEDGTPYQISLNPYSTVGARNDWQRGFDNAPPNAMDPRPDRAFDIRFQLGRAARRLLDQHNAATTPE